MTKVEQALLALKKEIDESSLIKEYFRLREVVVNDAELSLLKKRISDAQVKLSMSMANQAEHDINKGKYEELVNEYDAHPLIANFTQLQGEVQTFLREIVDLLE